LDRNVRLLDSPGVVFDDEAAMLGNCVDPDSVDDPLPAVEALLKRCNHESLLMNYNIPAFPPGDVLMFLAMVARSYGRVLKGGIPDKVAAARTVLRDWNQGRIPYYTPPTRDGTAVPDVSNDAVIVSEFAKEFDLSKFDDAVLGSLKNTDEMDYVRLEDNERHAKVDEEGLAFLASSRDDESMDEDNDDDSDVSEEGHALTKRRAQLADAEDYDFEMM